MAITFFESTKIESYSSCEIIRNRFTCKNMLIYPFKDLQYSAAIVLTILLVSDNAS